LPTCYSSVGLLHPQDLQRIVGCKSTTVVPLFEVELSVITLPPCGTVYHQNSYQTLIRWNSAHLNADSRRISTRSISICIRNAQLSASVCDSTCLTYDTLKTVCYYCYYYYCENLFRTMQLHLQHSSHLEHSPHDWQLECYSIHFQEKVKTFYYTKSYS